MSEMKLIAGKEYNIKHRRKGTFSGVCLNPGDEFATFVITGGEARYLTQEDRKGGEELRIRKTLCVFNEEESPCDPTAPK